MSGEARRAVDKILEMALEVREHGPSGCNSNRP